MVLLVESKFFFNLKFSKNIFILYFKRELKDAVQKIMSTEKDLSSQDVDEMMKEADLDHNGQLDYKEWFRLFTEPINLPNK